MQNSTRPNNPELDATKVPTEIDIAWAAGIYEGEGCCRLCGRGKRSLAVAVVQKDPELLYRLRDWFGGSVNLNKGAQTYVWDICGDRARIFLALIFVFMTARRKVQIESANGLDFLRGQSPIGLNILQLRLQLDRYYSDHKAEVRQRVRTAAAKKYKEISADPEWKKKDQEKKSQMRANMTPEQKQEALDYAKDWYRRKKERQQVFEIDKTA